MTRKDNFSNKKIIFRKQFELLAARYILGESKQLDVKGSKAQVDAAVNVIKESRQLLKSLQGGAPLSDVKKQLDNKRRASKVFKEVYGYTWPF